MVTLPSSVLALFLLSCVSSFLISFFINRVAKQLAFKSLLPSLPILGMVMGPLLVFFALVNQASRNQSLNQFQAWIDKELCTTLPYIAGAAALSFLLAKTNLPANLRGILLLAASVITTTCIPKDIAPLAVPSIVIGLISWNLAENLWYSHKPTIDDVLPPLVWLVGVSYLSATSSQASLAQEGGLLLGIIAVALLLKVIQTPFLHDDKLYVKRIVLAVSGGLAVLLVTTKLLLAINITSIALLTSAGIFMAYLSNALTDEEGTLKSPQAAVKFLILIGIMTLVATRFYGTFGLLVLGAVMLVSTEQGTAQYAGLFWVLRSLVQVFINSYNYNVTGINIMHPYVGAALYAGFLLILVFTLLLKEVTNRKLLLALFLGAGVLVPACSNFLLHAEPTSSFLVSTTTAAILLAVMGPALQSKNAKGHENLLLLPTLMVSTSIITNALIESGNESTIALKAIFLGYVIAFVLILCLLSWWLGTRSTKSATRV